jgi:hypothetical protein
MSFLSLCVAQFSFAQDAPADRIVIDINRRVWEPMVLASLPDPPSDNVSLDVSKDHPMLTSREAGANGIFEYRLHLPVDAVRYPFLVIKYKAKNLDTSRETPGISIDDTGGRGSKKDLFPLKEFNADGEEHELKKDLRELTPRGPIGRLVFTLMATDQGEASLEIVQVAFEGDPATPPAEVKDDSALMVAVFDTGGQPVKGAKVTIDAERKEHAKGGETDDKGEVSITPHESETGMHSLQVEAEGKATHYATIEKGSPGANVNLLNGVTYGGIIHNEEGQPVEGATVRIFAPPPGDAPAPYQAHVLRRAVMKTDAEGKWKSPVLPETETQVLTKLAHPDYIADKEYRNAENEPTVEEMKAGNGVMVLKK